MGIVTGTSSGKFYRDGKEIKRSRGLGDTIAKATKAVGIKPCGGCKKRQQYLNRKFPYKQNDSKD